MTDSRRTRFFKEPLLEFGHGQISDDPREGLFLYGPYESSETPSAIRVGVIGTSTGLQIYKRWTSKIKSHLLPPEAEKRREVSFPGFEAVFGISWPDEPVCELAIKSVALSQSIRLTNRYDRVFQTAGLYVDAIENYLLEEEQKIDLWFVVIPEDVYKFCRPKSFVPKDESVTSKVKITERQARKFQSEPSLFSEDMEAAQLFDFYPDFHDQIKARLLKKEVSIQIIRESSLENKINENTGFPVRRRQDDFHLAWNICTTAYFKSVGKPWKLAQIREGVCYIGLVFKQEHNAGSRENACCGAQMFLDSGDGLVFKGVRGNYYKESTKQFHLDEDMAFKLIKAAVDAYKKSHGEEPKEIFVHGKTYFNRDEWAGFTNAVSKGTKIVAVRIRSAIDLKLFSSGSLPVMRGTAYVVHDRHAFLWTKGFVPKLMTYPGRETPNPLSINITHGDADIDTVLNDVMALTKVNFNSCAYADGLPVTLRFADRVGEILTAAKIDGLKPLPFKYYI